MKKMLRYMVYCILLMLMPTTYAYAYDISNLVVDNNPRYGLAFPGKISAYYTTVDKAGPGYARMNIVWGDRETSDDVYSSWETGMDPYVYGMNSRGIECVFTFVTDCDWGAPITDPTKDAANQVPTDMAKWQEFVTVCVERYDFDGVDDMPSSSMRNTYYSIVNEWPSETHGSGGWAGTMEELITFTNTTYAGIQAANTECKLILGGWSSTVFNKITAVDLYLDSGEEYTIYDSDNYGNIETITITDYLGSSTRAAIRSYYRVLNESTYDAFDLHLYGPISDNEYRFEFIKDLIPNKTLVSLECGGPNQAYDSIITNNDLFNTAIQMQLDNISNDILFSLWFGLGSNYPYIPGGTITWGNAYIPWFVIETQAPRGCYWAHILLGELLNGVTSVVMVSDTVFVITRPDGEIYVGWGSGIMTLPSGFIPTQRIDITNSTTGTFSVGTTPDQEAEIILGELPIIISEMTLGE